ncbi:MAG: ABC transporter permease [Gemmatimonadetes bacterium]|nr:ABC transporter permease [Gemmatimonadota bacterium]
MRAPSLPRLVSLFRKEMLESFRDWKLLSLTLTFAPFFVLLMYAYLGHATPVYQIAVANQDVGAVTQSGEEEYLGAELVEILQGVQSPEGDTVLRVRMVNEEDVESLLESRRADLAIVIPAGFSEAVIDARQGGRPVPVPVRSRGDPANPDYMMAAVWADMTTMAYVEITSGLRSPALLAPETVSDSFSLSEFELYVPALLILSLMMLMFTAAGALIREKDKGTLIRLRLSNLTIVEWLTAVSSTQVIVGIVALALTYLTAVAVGYRANGSLLILFLVGALTSLSIMAFSVLVAAFLRTVFDLVTVGSFPFFILMFFSGGMFPLPGVSLFQWGERAVSLNEILPTTHAIAAMNRVLSYDAGLGEITYELTAIVLLTVAYFAVGTWIFARRHMPAVG